MRYSLKQACYLLTHNEMSMIDIAESVGFENSLYFSKVFHKQMGMPPTEYARQHKTSVPGEAWDLFFIFYLRRNQRKFPHSLDVHYPHFTSVSSHSFPRLKKRSFPLAQNLVKLGHSLNRSLRKFSLISPFTYWKRTKLKITPNNGSLENFRRGCCV